MAIKMKCPECHVEMLEVESSVDWDGSLIIYGCPRCHRLWIYSEDLVSSTSQLLLGEKIYVRRLEPYTEKYLAYPEVKQKFLNLLNNY